MSKCELSLNSIADSQFFSNNSFTYFFESFHLVKFQTFHTRKWKIVKLSRKSYFFCFNARREIHTTAVVLTKIFVSPKWWPFWIFKVFAKHKNAYISKTVLYGVINFGPAGYLCRVAMPIFKIFLSRQI